MCKCARSFRRADVDSIWQQIDRIFCMLPSFAAVACVNRAWNRCVHAIKNEWKAELLSYGMDMPYPSPRICARINRMDIDEKFLVPFTPPPPTTHQISTSESGGYEPSSPAFSPTGGVWP